MSQQRKPGNDQQSQVIQNNFKIPLILEKISLNVQQLQKLHNKQLVEIQQTKVQEISNEIDQITDQTNKLIASAREQIKRAGPQQRIFAKKLMEITREYSKTQQYAKEQYKIQLERQYKIAKPNATQQEISIAINSNNTQIFQQQMTSSKLQDQKRILGEVESRQHDMQQIEKSLTGLVELMQEMQALLSVLIIYT